MKTQILFAAALACALPVCAQPNPPNGLPFPVVSPAQAEKMMFARPIKIDLDNVTLSAALAELQKQSSVGFNIPRDTSKEILEKPVSIHLETPSVYRAFAEIVDEAGVKASLVRSNGYDSSQLWSVNFGETDTDDEALQAETGLFRTRLMTLNSTLSKTAIPGKTPETARSQQNNLTVSLALLPDPRLPMLGVPRAVVKRAQDDKGRSLLPTKNEGQDDWRYSAHSFYSNNYGRNAATLRLLPPEADATSLANLDGNVVYALVAKTEAWEIPDLLAQPEWKRTFKSGDQQFDITLKPTFKEEKNLSVAIEVVSNFPRVENRIGHPLMSWEPVRTAIEVTDADGTILRTSGGGGGTQSQKMTTQVNFTPANREYDEDGNLKSKPLTGPFKLRFEVPIDIVQTEVPFAFENVPLP